MSDVCLNTRSKKIIRRNLSWPVVSTALPEEIIDEILYRLPIKDLVRCSAVCKPWSSLLKSSDFIRHHLRLRHSAAHPNVDDHHLLLLCGNPPYSLRKDNRELVEHAKLKSPLLTDNKTNSSKALHDDDVGAAVIGTCNGLVCLVADNVDSTAIFIWNPSIRKFVGLPNPRAKVTKIKGTGNTWHASYYAFGYESSTDDYKVLRSSSTRRIEIWSLARGWKSLSAKVIPANFSHELTFHESYFLRYSTSVLINGALNWVQKCKKGGYTIGTFDMSSELFGEITPPVDHPEEFETNGYPNTTYFISRYRESIAFFKTCLWTDGPYGRDDLIFWVMKEYNVAGSWIKLSVCIRSLHHIRCQPYFRRNGELILVTSHGSLLVDIESKHRKDIFGIMYTKFIDSFVESLVLFDHPNVISY